MNIHISNVYGMIKNQRIAQDQRRIAEVGHRLGYLEIGIYNYPAEHEPQAEQAKRMEGILAAVKPDDILILQLPTGNGERFDTQLVKQINTHQARLIILWHSLKYYQEQTAKLAIWSDSEVPVCTVREAVYYEEDYQIQKMLIDACIAGNEADENMIHIGMGVHDKDGNYCSWLGITMQSIIEHTKAKVEFHIMHDDTLTLENKRRLIHIASKAGHKTQFHRIDESCFSSQNSQMGIYTIGALFRILLPEVCSDLSRIIYLDSDLLVNCDIKDLWDTDIRDYCLAAVPDDDIVTGKVWAAPVAKGQMKREGYFNSGVIYMNLEKIRRMGNMREEVVRYIEENTDTNLPDQDALNVIYQNETLLLEEKWNRFAKYVSRDKEKKLAECIYHYVGTVCCLYNETAMDVLYMQTANRTPWGNELSRKFINMSVNRQWNRIDNLRKVISKISEPEKKMYFYGDETMAMQNMYHLLSVTPQNACRILTKTDSSEGLPCKELAALQKEEQNSCIVFLLPDADGGMAIANLEHMGMQNQTDFFVIPCLLKQEDGGYLV